MGRKNASVIKEYGYEGDYIDGALCLSMSKYYHQYFFLDGRTLFLGDVVSGGIVNKTEVRKLRKENPYLHYDDGTTHLVDSSGNFILIDTCDFDKVSGVCWAVVRKGVDSHRISIVGWLEGGKQVSLTKHLFGRVIKYKTDDRLNLSKSNITETVAERVYSNRLLKAEYSGNYSTEPVSYDNVIKPTRVEGDVIGDFLVLSKYDENQYYVRYNTGTNYVIGIKGYDSIFNNEKSLRVLTDLPTNPYLDLEGGVSVVFDKYATPIMLDTEDRKNLSHTLHYGARGSGKTKFVLYFNPLTKGNAVTYARELLGLTDFSRVVAYRNGDSRDVRRANLVETDRGTVRVLGAVAKNSKSGITGVTELPNGRYKAVYRGRILGSNVEFNKAVELRKEAERKDYERVYS